MLFLLFNNPFPHYYGPKNGVRVVLKRTFECKAGILLHPPFPSPLLLQGGFPGTMVASRETDPGDFAVNFRVLVSAMQSAITRRSKGNKY